MTYDELLHYIEHEMSMQHVYQPVVIEALLAANGSATLRQLAHALLGSDEGALATAEARLRKMPLEVLRNRGVVTSPSPAQWSLQTSKLTHTQRATLRAACHVRLAKFLDAHDPWAGASPTVGFGIPYQVFLAAGGRCLLCHQDKPLQVDHIQPQSKQGANTLDNLQALCADCNQGKSNGAWIDFRPSGHPHRPKQKKAGVTYFWDQQQVDAVQPAEKLVRDKIPDVVRADGREPDVRVLTKPEYREALGRKLHEEADELSNAVLPEQVDEEAADLLEVLQAVVAESGTTWSAVEAVRQKKHAERGGFSLQLSLKLT